jgi:hypothetical protein
MTGQESSSCLKVAERQSATAARSAGDNPDVAGQTVTSASGEHRPWADARSDPVPKLIL